MPSPANAPCSAQRTTHNPGPPFHSLTAAASLFLWHQHQHRSRSLCSPFPFLLSTSPAGLPPPPPSRRRQSTPADPGVCCPPSRLAARCWPRPLISLRLRSLIAATPLTVFPVRTLTILVVADVFSDLPLRSSHPFCNWYRIALAAILRFILRRLVGSLARSPR